MTHFSAKRNNRKTVQVISPSSPQPPKVDEVKVYFLQRGMMESEAEQFFLSYDQKNWKNAKGGVMSNWKGLAYKWINAILLKEPWRFDKSIH
jgi:hypothetical protein